MLFGVSANRMTLLKLRKRLAMARHGHTLMKHKYDELMHIFQREIHSAMDLREVTESLLRETYDHFTLGSAVLGEEATAALLALPAIEIQLTATTENLLNITVPVMSATVKSAIPPVSLYQTNADIDTCIRNLSQGVPRLFKLAESQQRLVLLVREIKRTRRRVNALEYVLIPQLETQIKFIQMKLDEMERGNISRLMRIKAVIRGSG